MAATFDQVPGTPLWLLAGAPSGVQVAYVPFGDAGGVPASLGLADAWTTYPGTFLAVPGTAAAGQGLADALAAWRGPADRLAWVANPDDPVAAWRGWRIAAAAGTTTGLAGVELRSLALWVGAGAAVGPAGDAIVLTPGAGADALTLTAGWGAERLALGQATVTVPLAGAQTGCLLTAATLTDATGTDDLTRLDAGVRLYGPVPHDPHPLLADRVASWRFPVFTAAQPATATALPVSVSLDPLAPLDPGRTFLGLVPAGTDAGPELRSAYVTTNGLEVRLTPLAPPSAPLAAAKLVPAVRALSSPPSERDPLTLVPSGAFRIRVLAADGTDAPSPQRLMCGISGIESVELPGAGCELWFSPGGAALAGGKGLEGAAAHPESAVATAYASVFAAGGAGGLMYRAQADSAALFEPTGTDGFLGFRELAGIELPPAPDGGALPAGYPMLPFTAIVDAELEPYRQLELGGAAPARRAAIGAQAGASGRLQARPWTKGYFRSRAPAAVPAAASAPEPTSVTPQGLLADITGGVITDLTLVRSAGASGTVEPLQITGISPALAAALQSSQLFLVASDPKALQAQPPAAAVQGTIGIPTAPDGSEPWSIDVWPADWGPTKTLLVLKFAGKPLLDLAADLGSWSQPDVFNPGGAADAQAVLLASIAAASAHPGDPDFAPFLSLIADPSWHGILFLNAPINPATLPSEIAGLAAGLDARAFKAHHVGLTVTPVTASATAIDPGASSLFGLIDYESPTTANGGRGPYQFDVDTLKVRFENSLVATFSSRIQLLVEELFGEPSTLVNPDPKAKQPQTDVLLLDGVYQRQGTGGSYAFSTTDDSFFTMSSAVLASVEIASAQFVTVVAPSPTDATQPALSRFELAGALRFEPFDFDLLSFGPEPGAAATSPQQLSFTNLAIDLAYVPADREKGLDTDVYTFDAAKLVCDPVQSKPRDASLFAGFPLTLSGFVHVPAPPPPAEGAKPAAAATPASLGFLGVGVSELPQGAIKAPWFGVTADLGLGTAGALAAQAGFKATLLAAWAPGTPKTPTLAAGLKLPGTQGDGKLLSLQSVLKLKIGSLSLDRDKTTYVLTLDRIALSVLMLTIPSGGDLKALLFADPTGSDHTTLGWYAGWAKEKKA